MTNNVLRRIAAALAARTARKTPAPLRSTERGHALSHDIDPTPSQWHDSE